MNKSITIIVTRFPWPLDNGLSNKNYWLIKNLSNHFDINLIVIQRRKINQEQISKIKKYVKKIEIHSPNLIEIFINLIKNIFNKNPLQLAFFKSSSAEKSLKNNFKHSEAFVFSLIRGVQNIEPITDDKTIICDYADSLGQAYIRNSSQMSFPLSYIYLIEGKRMLNYEIKITKKISQAFLFNEQEVNFFKNEKIKKIPHGINPLLFKDFEKTTCFSDGVVLFGKMDFKPNEDAAIWFAENILPKLHESIRFYIVGSHPTEKIKNLAKINSKITVTGFLENPYPAIKGCIATVCPIRLGGGIQNKVIESLAIGKISLISPLAAAAFNFTDEGDAPFFICHNELEWINKIHKIFLNKYDYSNKVIQGIEFAKRNFSWDSYTETIKNSITKNAN